MIEPCAEESEAIDRATPRGILDCESLSEMRANGCAGPPVKYPARPAVPGAPAARDGRGYLLTLAMNSSMGIAAMVITRMLPREESSAEILAMVRLSGASTMFTKS